MTEHNPIEWTEDGNVGGWVAEDGDVEMTVLPPLFPNGLHKRSRSYLWSVSTLNADCSVRVHDDGIAPTLGKAQAAASIAADAIAVSR